MVIMMQRTLNYIIKSNPSKLNEINSKVNPQPFESKGEKYFKYYE